MNGSWAIFGGSMLRAPRSRLLHAVRPGVLPSPVCGARGAYYRPGRKGDLDAGFRLCSRCLKRVARSG